MTTTESVSDLFQQASAQKKSHDVPIDHLDYKYVTQCNDVKELEKIYKILVLVYEHVQYFLVKKGFYLYCFFNE